MKKTFWNKARKRWVLVLLSTVLAVTVWGISVPAEQNNLPLGSSAAAFGALNRSVKPVSIGDGVTVKEIGTVSTGDLQLEATIPNQFKKIIFLHPDGTTETKTVADAVEPTPDVLVSDEPPIVYGESGDDDATKTPAPPAKDGETPDGGSSIGEIVPIGGDDSTKTPAPPAKDGETPDGGFSIGEIVPIGGDDATKTPAPPAKDGETPDGDDVPATTTLPLGTSTDTIVAFSPYSGDTYTLRFSAADYGFYSFELFESDAADTIRYRTVSYMVKDVIDDDALSLQLLAPATQAPAAFTLYQQRVLTVQFTPTVLNQTETLKITLPPYFKLIQLPANDSTKTFTQTTVPLPEEFYNDSMSDILRTSLTGYRPCAEITVVFNERLTDTSKFDILISYVGPNASLGKLMVAYGENPDQIPLRIAADLTSAGTSKSTDREVIAGTSVLTNPDGSQALVGSTPTFPTKDATPDMIIPSSWVQANNLGFIMDIGIQKYPVTNVYAYVPWREGSQLTGRGGGIATPEVVTRDDGKPYWKVKFNDILDFNNGTNYYRYFSATANQNVVEVIKAIPGTTYDFGQTYYEYTHKGVTYNEKSINIPGTMTVPDYGRAITSSRVSLHPETSSFGTTDRHWWKEQGTGSSTLYNYQIALDNNIYNYAKIGSTYENSELVIEAKDGMSIRSLWFQMRQGYSVDCKYYIYGETEPRTMKMSLSNEAKFTFPVTDAQRIYKVELPLVNYYPWHGGNFWFALTNYETSNDGTPLPSEYKTNFKVSLLSNPEDPTKGQDQRTYQAGLDRDQRTYETYNPVLVDETVTLFKRLPEDCLLFGTLDDYSNTSGMSLATPGTTYWPPSDGRNGRFGFKKYLPKMKDYENVVVTGTPRAPRDLAGFSMMSGVYLYDFIPGKVVEKADVFYELNTGEVKQVAADTIVQSGVFGTYPFELEYGEYAVKFWVEFGTLYGEKMAQHFPWRNNDKVKNGYGSVDYNQGYGSRTSYMIAPYYTSKRMFFEGTSDQVAVTAAESFFVDATVTTDTKAQHINDNTGTESGRFFTDNAYSTVSMTPYSTGSLTRYSSFTMENITANSKVNFYQGEYISYAFYNEGRTPTGRTFKYPFDYYIEVNQNFELYNINSLNFIKKKDLGDGYDLYHFQGELGSTGSDYLNVRLSGDIYVKGDAVPGAHNVIRYSGMTHDHFPATYMQGNYFDQPPYQKINISNTRAFPAIWSTGGSDQWTLDHTVPFYFSTIRGFNVTVLKQVSSGLKATLGHGNSATPLKDGEFQAKQKDNLRIFGEIGNSSSDTVIPYMRTTFELPTELGTTESRDEEGNPQDKYNDYSLRITGPATVDGRPDAIVKYYNLSGTEVTDISTATNRDAITKVVVDLPGIAPDTKHFIRVPVFTEYLKKGSAVDPIFTYVGATTQTGADATTLSPISRITAPTFTYISYLLKSRVMLDEDEVGALKASIRFPGVVEIKVTYDDNGVEKELYKNSDVYFNEHSLYVNDDVKNIYVTVLDDRYLLSIPNPALSQLQSSDFPRGDKISSVLKIDLKDLENNIINKYDAALITKPMVTVQDIDLRVNKHLDIAPLIGRSTAPTAKPTAYLSYYKDELIELSPTDVATAEIYSPAPAGIRYVSVDGEKKGSSTYYYKLTNRLGDEFKFGPFNINVTAGFVPNQTLIKSFDAGSVSVNTTDSFHFNIWPSDKTEAQAVKISTLANQSPQYLYSTIELSEINYIREIDIAEGYDFVRFEGELDGAPLTFTDEGGGLFSFSVPKVANYLLINVINKNKLLALELKKDIPSTSHTVNPNDSFNLKVTDHSDSSVVVFDGGLQSGGSAPITLQYGKTYLIEETIPAGMKYKLNSVKAVTADGITQAGPAPTRTTATSYLFKVGTGSSAAKSIIVENLYPTGPGLNLEKVIPATSVPKEEFLFELVGDNNYLAYGKTMADASTTYPTGVKWYDSPSLTGAELSLATLPVGEYTITETGTNHSFDFDKYVGSGAQVPSTQAYKFEVTEAGVLADIKIHNKIKTIGSVTLTKELPSDDFKATDVVFKLKNDDTGQQYTSTLKVSDYVTGTGLVFNDWKLDGGTATNQQGSLPLGKYTLTEQSSAIFDFVRFDNLPTGAVATGSSVTFTLSGNGNEAVTLSAENKLKTSSITLTKTILGELTGNSESFQFDVYKYIDGGAGDVKVNSTPLVITIPAGATTGAIILPETNYGRYYIRELQSASFKLDGSVSDVIDHSATVAVANAKTLNTAAPISFTANNELNKAKKDLNILKKVLDDDATIAQADFTFTIKWYGVDMYYGTVSSKNSAVGSASGANITWVKSSAHSNGIVVGGALRDLYYGDYTITESIPAASEFMLKGITSTTGLGTPNVPGKSLTFTINDTSEALADYTVTFENQYHKVKDATITKSFATGSSNIRGITFDFEYRIGSDDSTKKTVAGVNEVVTKPIVLERGMTYQIKEQAEIGYEIVGYSITTNSASSPNLTATDKGSGWWEFTVPVDASQLEITATNTSLAKSISLAKQVEGLNLLPATEFSIKVTEAGRPDFTVWESTRYKAGDTFQLDNVVNGITYLVEEAANTTFRLDKIRVQDSLNSGIPESDVIKVSSDSYSFKKLTENDDATIKVVNRMATGRGISLDKHLPNTVLDKEQYEFTLSGPNGYKAYGVVDNTAVYPAAVTWHYKSDFSDAPVLVDYLPIGSYTLTETSSNTNFEFDRFKVSGKPDVATNSLTIAILENNAAVTAIEVHNRPKTDGKIVLTKNYPALLFAGDTFKFTLTETLSGKVYTATATVPANSTTVTITSWNDGVNNLAQLPLGRYHLTESSAGLNYVKDGFDSATAASNPNANVSLSANRHDLEFTLSNSVSGASTVNLMAANKLGEGSITINKTVSGVGTHLPRTFEFRLFRMVGASSEQLDENGNITTDPNDTIKLTITSVGTTVSKVISNLPYGRYYAEEHDDDYFKLMGTSSVSVVGDSPVRQDMKAGNASLSFNANNRSRTADQNFVLQKSLGYTLPDEQTTFTFELYFENRVTPSTKIYDGTVSTEPNGSLSQPLVKWAKVGMHSNGTPIASDTEIENLEYGTYTIKETATGNGYRFDKIVSGGGIGQSVANGWKFDIDRTSDSADMSFMLYNQPKSDGSLKINKKIEGGNPFPSALFTFEAENLSNGEKYTTQIKAGQGVTSWIRTSDNTTVGNGQLPLGKYRLTEKPSTNFTLARFENVAPPSAGTASTTEATIALSGSNKTASVDAINKVKTDGSLTVMKRFEGGYNFDDSRTFHFQLIGPEINGVMPTTGTPVSVTNANNWSVSLSGLVRGKYLLQEDLSANPEYQLVSIGDGANTVTTNDLAVTLSADTGQSIAKSITATNKVASTGELLIAKTIEGENGNNNAVFKFKLTDALGGTKDVELRANEEKRIAGLLYGNIQVAEALEDNYDHTGMALGTAARQQVSQITVPVISRSTATKVESFSKNKADASLSIKASVTKDLESVLPGETFKFILHKSSDEGKTWTPVTPKTKSATISLQIGETYTFSGLLRGASYKLVADIDPLQVYTVLDILLDNGTVGTVNLDTGSFMFSPDKRTLSSSVSFLLDIKRRDVKVVKFFEWPTDILVEGATFQLSRLKDDDSREYLFSDKTDAQGAITFKGIPAGKYVLTEVRAPKGFVILEREIFVLITQNSQTGQLDLALDKPKTATIQDGAIWVPNGWKSKVYRGGSSEIDGNINSLIKEEDILGVFDNNEPPIAIKLPNAGGLPASYIGFVGLALMLLGGITTWRSRKKSDDE